MKKKLLPALLLIADFLWIWFILSRSYQPAAVSSRESGWVLELVRRLLPFATMRLVRKAAHVTEFFILGALFFFTWTVLKKPGVLVPCTAGLLIAICDELSQLFSQGRSCEFPDILLDFSGVLAAVLGLFLLFRVLRKRKRQSPCSTGD